MLGLLQRGKNRLSHFSSVTRKRFLSSSEAASSNSTLPTEYSNGVKWMHWISGGSMIGCVATVLLAQNEPKENKEKKGRLMWIHKSFGTLAALALLPRLAIRLSSRVPGHVVGANDLEKLAAKASHVALYGFIFVMPVSGVAMNYYSGGSLPLFVGSLPKFDDKNKNKELAGKAYNIHSTSGKLLEYMVPLHVGGAVMHYAKGHTIFSRIWPAAKAAGPKAV